MMNLEFENIYEMQLPINTLEYSTVRIQKAVLPMSYFNISGELHNNYMKYVIIENGAIQSNGSLVVADGLYSPASYNKAIQKELKKIDMEKAVEIEYLKERGLIKIILNNNKFALHLHNTLCHLLGIECGGGYTRETTTGNKLCQFMRHKKYVIECDLVDSELNLINGQRSRQVDYFLPLGKYYGDSSIYIPRTEKKVSIRKYNSSDVKIKILNHLGEEIKFDSEFNVTLILEQINGNN